MTTAHACLLGLWAWASIWTSPGREDPAWVGGSKVTVLDGGAGLWSSPFSWLQPQLLARSCLQNPALSLPRKVLAVNAGVS